MPTQPHYHQVLELVNARGLIRARDLDSFNIPRVVLSRMVHQGQLERLSRGLYALPDRSVSEHSSLVEASRKYPQAVICLLSALRFHELTTQAPFEVWLAIDNKARKPSLDYPPLHVVRYSGKALTEGVVKHTIDGSEIKVTCVAKTVADCFKYRNKIGLDVAIESLKDVWQNKRCEVDELWYYAKLCRVNNVIRPYLESLTS